MKRRDIFALYHQGSEPMISYIYSTSGALIAETFHLDKFFKKF